MQCALTALSAWLHCEDGHFLFLEGKGIQAAACILQNLQKRSLGQILYSRAGPFFSVQVLVLMHVPKLIPHLSLFNSRFLFLLTFFCALNFLLH